MRLSCHSATYCGYVEDFHFFPGLIEVLSLLAACSLATESFSSSCFICSHRSIYFFLSQMKLLQRKKIIEAAHRQRIAMIKLPIVPVATLFIQLVFQSVCSSILAIADLKSILSQCFTHAAMPQISINI